ncbi:class I SAM-dependent methyltransferase [bacterium]|nr:class I SAM-dependent methyltransferase [bacterium]
MNQLRSLLTYLRFFPRAQWALREGRRLGLPGLEFDRYGRSLGGKLGFRHPAVSCRLRLNPVSSVRYFEFDFVNRHLQDGAIRALDVSSPWLFSFYEVSHREELRVFMINPDVKDCQNVRKLITALRVERISAECIDVRSYEDSAQNESFDAIWAISVIEHIDGEYDDRDAICQMWKMLKPGGQLLLTFPVSAQFEEEFRPVDQYGLNTHRNQKGQHFFQRYYDEEAINSRILEPLDAVDPRIEFYGERVPGWFQRYESQWTKAGLSRTVYDPRDMARQMVRYDSLSQMPGKGVCGLALKKPIRQEDSG